MSIVTTFRNEDDCELMFSQILRFQQRCCKLSGIVAIDFLNAYRITISFSFKSSLETLDRMFLKNERMGMDIFNLTSWKQATEGYMD